MRQMGWLPAIPLLLGLLGCDVNISGNNLSGNKLNASVDAKGAQVGVGEGVTVGNGNTTNNTTTTPAPTPQALVIEMAPTEIYRMPASFSGSEDAFRNAVTGPKPGDPAYNPGGTTAAGTTVNGSGDPAFGTPMVDPSMFQALRVSLQFSGGVRKSAADLAEVKFTLPQGIHMVKAPNGAGSTDVYLYAESTVPTGSVEIHIDDTAKAGISAVATASVMDEGSANLVFD